MSAEAADAGWKEAIETLTPFLVAKVVKNVKPPKA